MTWKPSSPERGSVLGLADPDPSGSLPKGATVADVLAWALALPGCDDIITGIVEAVSVELAALATATTDRQSAQVMILLGRRLDAASLLLRWADNRAPMPKEYDPDAETQTEGPGEGGEPDA